MKFRHIVTKALKENRLVSFLYIIYMSCLLKIIHLFFPYTEKKVIFVSYGGKQVSDSPLRLYRLMKKDPFFSDYKLIWGSLYPQKLRENGMEAVKMDSIQYFKECMTARIWITNSGIKRYTNMRGNHTLFVNTWHGIPMKKIGRDEVGVKKTPLFQKKWDEFATADLNCYCSEYDRKILAHVFNAPIKSFFKTGLPRNDELYRTGVDTRRIREKLKIPLNKKVILYAPTIRGNQTNVSGTNIFSVPLHPQLWNDELPDYVILFRAHYNVNEIGEGKFSNWIDVTNYGDLNELMQVSDVLVTDYSSLIFDYSILSKPIFCYAYDFYDYQKYQGIYQDHIEQRVPNYIETEEELIRRIKDIDYDLEVSKTKKFCHEYIGDSQGHSGEKTIDLMKQFISREG